VFNKFVSSKKVAEKKLKLPLWGWSAYFKRAFIRYHAC